MTTENTLWILIVLDDRSRLMRGRRPNSNRTWWLPLEVVAELANPYAELGPAARLSGPLDRRDVSLVDRRAEFLQRYVRDVHHWMLGLLREHRIELLNVLASEQLLGALQHGVNGDLPPQIRMQGLDPSDLPRSEIERHRAILSLLQPATDAGAERGNRGARPRRPEVRRASQPAQAFRARPTKRRA